ncbi:hypothetical protein OF83DRAFT_591412 [Amylostereum chailletii]|nr:hypothetical protein OF83DRAFT_591412 [Amylostereum chailletii]
MAAWTQAVHLHPWFKMSSLKRPHSPSPDGSDSDTPLFPTPSTHNPLHARKRRRSTALESGLARLSLTPPSNSATHDLPSTTTPPFDAPMEFDDLPSLHDAPDPEYTTSTASIPVTLASSIEEPPEIQMRTSSWYEPSKDRKPPSPPVASTSTTHSPRRRRPGIIVTDLDTSDDEDADEDRTRRASASGAPSVLPSALELLCARVGQLPLPLPEQVERAHALALVPFRPLSFQARQGNAIDDGAQAVIEEPDPEPTLSDDVMDVEPMDIEP